MESLDEQRLDACVLGDRKEMARLLRKGANIEARDEPGQSTSLHLASMEDHESVVTPLLGKGAAVGARNKQEITALTVRGIKGELK